jgi:hypothetical protein
MCGGVTRHVATSYEAPPGPEPAGAARAAVRTDTNHCPDSGYKWGLLVPATFEAGRWYVTLPHAAHADGAAGGPFDTEADARRWLAAAPERRGGGVWQCPRRPPHGGPERTTPGA